MASQHPIPWQEVPEQDLDQWRSLPVTQAFLAYLRHREAAAIDQMGAAVSEQAMGLAAVARGEHLIVREIISSVVTSRAQNVVHDEDDAPYTDPCALPVKP